jgi:hypothetical protein
MKTLRRQVEYLQAEINSRVENYHTVCEQNEKLFTYVQELVRANDYNVNNMRDYCRNIHEELRLVKRERAQLVEKLEFMVNSKRMLADLSQELKEAQVSGEEMAHRLQEAEIALRQAMEGRSHTEEELHDKVEKMKDYETLLGRYREQSHELQSLDLAEEFFFKNRQVLKSAYARFRRGVQVRRRLTNIRELCQHVHRKYLIGETLLRWSSFLQRRRIMQRNRTCRQKEVVKLLFFRWKVYYRYERIYTQARRKRLQRTVFSMLVENVLIGKRRQWILDTMDERKQMRFVQSLFLQWKQSTTFLDWNSALTRARERSAQEFFLKKIFVAWRTAQCSETAQLTYASSCLAMRNVQRHLYQWRSLCMRQWKYRGRLLRRFLAVSRRRLSAKTYYDSLERHAKHFHWQFRKRHLFARWRRLVQRRRQYMTILAVPATAASTAIGPPTTETAAAAAATSAFERKMWYAAVFAVAPTHTTDVTNLYHHHHHQQQQQQHHQQQFDEPRQRSLSMRSEQGGLFPDSTPRRPLPLFPATPFSQLTMSTLAATAAGNANAYTYTDANTDANIHGDSHEYDGPLLLVSSEPIRVDEDAREVPPTTTTRHEDHPRRRHVDEAVVSHWSRQRRLRQAFSMLSHYLRRLLRRHWCLWQARAHATRQKCGQVSSASRHHRRRQLHAAWTTWFERRHLVHRRLRSAIRTGRVQTYLRRWHRYVCEIARRRRCREYARVVRQRHIVHRCHEIWDLWTSTRRRHQRLRRTAGCVQAQHARLRWRRTWQVWHGQYVSRLISRQKELMTDVTRLQALDVEHRQTLQTQRGECQQWLGTSRRLEEELATLRVHISTQETHAQSQAQVIDAQTTRQVALEKEVQSLQAQVAAMHAEKRRWLALEASLYQERVHQQQLREHKQQEVTLQVTFLQQEHHRWHQSLHAPQPPHDDDDDHHQAPPQPPQPPQPQPQPQPQRVISSTAPRNETSHAAAAFYPETDGDAWTLEQDLREESRRWEQAPPEQHAATWHSVPHMHSKAHPHPHHPHEVVGDVEQVHVENAHGMRQQRAENDVLTSDAGVAQAKVLALLEMAEEASESKGKMHVQEMDGGEQRYAF